MAEVFHRYIGKDGKAPKVSPSERKERARQNELAAELTDERAQAVRVNRMRGEMLLAKARGELIVNELVVMTSRVLARRLAPAHPLRSTRLRPENSRSEGCSRGVKGTQRDGNLAAQRD